MAAYLITDLKTLKVQLGSAAPARDLFVLCGQSDALQLASLYRRLEVGSWSECQRLAWREVKLSCGTDGVGDALGYGPAFLRREHIGHYRAALRR